MGNKPIAFNEGYAQFIERFKQVALIDPRIDATMIIGSRARTDHTADEWSDLDLILFVKEPELFIRESDWYESLGDIWLSFISRTSGDDPERRVLYADGLDIDFAIDSYDTLVYLADNDLPPGALEIFRRGFRILVDKTGLLQTITVKPLSSFQLSICPQEDEFTKLVHDFWFHTLWTAKHLRRGEIWWAKVGCDEHLKNLLLTMLRWHAIAHRGEQVDTWLGARFVEEWADPQAVTAFTAIFAHYNAEDVRRALLATMSLFRRLAVETANQWCYPYPTAGEQQTSALVEQLLTAVE